jgi:outer membrane protein assembly factor BamA
MLVEIHFRGSPPPIPSIYECRFEIDGKPYSREVANECLNKILLSGYFTSGKLTEERLPSGRVLVVFELEAPTLKVAAMDVTVRQGEEDSVRNWLAKDQRTLRIGSEFDNASLGITIDRITHYYGSQGRSVGVSSTTHLDYEQGYARVDFSVIQGPPELKEALLPPYGPECDDPIAKLNWMDVDDFALFPLARSVSEILPFSCFDKSLVKKDEDRLKRTGAFEFVAITVAGTEGDREVSLTLRGKRIIVNRIQFECYGNASGCEKSSPNLPLRAGEVYTRSAAHQAAKDLERYYSRLGQRVEVIESAEVNPDATTTVRFSILSYNKNRVFVDGQEVIAASTN